MGRVGTRDEVVDAIDERGRVEGGGVDRHLLAHAGLQARVEGEQELLDLAPWVRSRFWKTGDATKFCTVETERQQEAEAADLVTDRPASRDAELADLLVQVAQVGDLELLRLALDRREAVRPERQPVAERAGDRAGIGGLVQEQILTRRLIARRGVGQVADRVGWQHHRQDEIREGLHLRRAQLRSASEQPTNAGLNA